jgi:hypothetical protein
LFSSSWRPGSVTVVALISAEPGSMEWFSERC